MALPELGETYSSKLFIEGFVGILVTSSIAALVFQRLKLALIPAFLLAGIVVGPSGLGLVQSSPMLKDIGHLAVVLLLFGVGMELHLSAFRRSAVTLLGTSLAACVLCVLVGIPVAMAFGLPLPQAVIVAMAFSLSSTALVLRLLTLSRELVRAHGQVSLAVLVAQDLAVLFMLASIPAIGVWATGDATSGSSQAVTATGSGLSGGLSMAVGLIGLVVIGQKLLPRILTESLYGRSSEVLMLSSITLALLAAYVTESMGFSLEMGAFLVGFLLASSPFRYHLAGQVAPLRDLFMAVFFTTLGMEVKLDIVIANFGVVLFGLVGLIIVKSILISLSAWLFGVPAQVAVLCGIILSQAGEFSLIVFGTAGTHGFLSSSEVSILIAIVVLSLVITPSLFLLARRISPLAKGLPDAPWFKWAAVGQNEDAVLDATGEHILIAGYGPVGRGVAALLTENGTPFTVIELNKRTVHEGQRAGVNIVFGDVTNESVLRAAHIEGARAFILTFPDTNQAKAAAAKARLIQPELEIIARAPSADEGVKLRSSEIDDVVIDEEESVRKMVEVAHRLSRGSTRGEAGSKSEG